MSANFHDYINKLRQHVVISETYNERRTISHRAIDAFERAINLHALSKYDLDEIIKAATSRYLGPFYIGTELMTSLYKQFPEVGEAWLNLAQSSVAHERWVAITSLSDERIPGEFAEQLITKAINDKSSKVRLFAIERVYTRKLYSLVPEIIRRSQVERDQKILRHIRWVLSMIENRSIHRETGAKDSDLPGDIDIPIKEIIAASIPPDQDK